MDRRLEVRQFSERLQLRDGGDGRTVFGRVVPYDTVTEFEDHDGKVKQEMFRRGALAHSGRAWHRVVLYYSHADILPNRIGYGLALDERADGGYATFRLDINSLEQAREALSTSHGALSLGFYPDITRVSDRGVLERIKVGVEHVAAVPEAAYEDARVLAIRGREQGSNDAQEPLQRAMPRLAKVLEDLAYLKATPEERALRDGLR